MDLNTQFIQRKIKLKRNKFSHQFRTHAVADYYIPILLERTSKVIDYVDVKKDETIYNIERQNINPFFYELSFFESVEKIKVNEYSDLTSDMKEYIRNDFVNTSTDVGNDSKLEKWYDNIGINNYADKKVNEAQITDNRIKEIYDKNDTNSDIMDKLEMLPKDLVSKAKYLSIFINK